MNTDRSNSVGDAAASQPAEGSPQDRYMWVRSASLTGVFFLLVMYTLYFAASLFMPIVLAFLLSLVLSPVVGVMTRLFIPRAVGAMLAMLSVAAVMAAGIYALGAPAAEWIEKAPSELRNLESRLAWVKDPIQKINETRQQVDELTGNGDRSTVRRQSSFSLVDAILNRTPDVMFGIAVMLILLFFVLASGDALLNKLVKITPALRDKKRVVEAARDIQRHVSIYLATITLINICVGAVIALAMYGLNMPNPVLWGAMVGVLNYIPYLGVAISIVIVGFASMLTFDTLGQVLLPPAVIFAVNVVEGQFLTPIIAGRRLALSPVAIFLTLVILGWMWGVVGVLIAVPVLATVKLVCEQIGPLEPIATLLARD